MMDSILENKRKIHLQEMNEAARFFIDFWNTPKSKRIDYLHQVIYKSNLSDDVVQTYMQTGSVWIQLQLESVNFATFEFDEFGEKLNELASKRKFLNNPLSLSHYGYSKQFYWHDLDDTIRCYYDLFFKKIRKQKIFDDFVNEFRDIFTSLSTPTSIHALGTSKDGSQTAGIEFKDFVSQDAYHKIIGFLKHNKLIVEIEDSTYAWLKLKGQLAGFLKSIDLWGVSESLTHKQIADSMLNTFNTKSSIDTIKKADRFNSIDQIILVFKE